MKCKLCGFKMGSFRDELSKREAAFSGLCQTCQDSFFGGATETQMVAKVAAEEETNNDEPQAEVAAGLPQWIEDSRVESG